MRLHRQQFLTKPPSERNKKLKQVSSEALRLTGLVHSDDAYLGGECGVNTEATFPTV